MQTDTEQAIGHERRSEDRVAILIERLYGLVRVITTQLDTINARLERGDGRFGEMEHAAERHAESDLAAFQAHAKRLDALELRAAVAEGQGKALVRLAGILSGVVVSALGAAVWIWNVLGLKLVIGQ